MGGGTRAPGGTARGRPPDACCTVQEMGCWAQGDAKEANGMTAGRSVFTPPSGPMLGVLLLLVGGCVAAKGLQADKDAVTHGDGSSIRQQTTWGLINVETAVAGAVGYAAIGHPVRRVLYWLGGMIVSTAIDRVMRRKKDLGIPPANEHRR